MGTDIHVYVEKYDGERWQSLPVPSGLEDRCYGRFAFLTGGRLRGSKKVVWQLPQPRGWPENCSDYVREKKEKYSDDPFYAHSVSYLTLAELLAVDYDLEFSRERGILHPVRETPITTVREALGESWFEILNKLEELCGEASTEHLRIVFFFDS